MTHGLHFRSTRAEISRQALTHNVQLIKEKLGNNYLIGVVKADAYGHGMISTAQAIAANVDAYAVAYIDEALALREAGLTQPIVLLEGCFSAAELPICAHYNLLPVIHQQHQLDAVLTARLARPVGVWLKADTGLHRLGWRPEQLPAVYQQLDQSTQVASITLMSHLAIGDTRHQFTQQQLEAFTDLCAQTKPSAQMSVINSPALLSATKDISNGYAHWVRSGIAMYGVAPILEGVELPPLQPVMRLLAPIIALRDIPQGDTVGYGGTWRATRPSKIATVAIGYADGYPRSAANGTPVWLHGKQVPLAGTVSMDMITLDVTDLEQVAIGDEVELWGPNLSVNIVAEHANTISYDLFTGVSQRVPRLEV